MSKADSEERASREGRVTARAVVLGVMLTAIWAATSTYTDQYAGVTWTFGWGALPAIPVALAFLLVLANGLLVRLRPAIALTRSEVLVVYCLLTISTAVVVFHVPYVLSIAAYPYYHARIEPRWESAVLPHLPGWLHPADHDRIPWFWEGLPAGESLPWRDWVGPTISWHALALAMMVAMLCLGALLRKDWIERQRLTFPLTEIPMSLVGESGPLPTLRTSMFGNKVFWAGFSVGGGATLLVWLNGIYPAVPAPQLYASVGQRFIGAGLPLSALSDMFVAVTPATVGIMCLLPAEVSLSVWAWYLLFMLFLLACGALGIPPSGSQVAGSFVPRGFADYTSFGGFIAVSAMVLYQSRGSFGYGLRSLLLRKPEPSDLRAPMDNRAALLGLLVSNAFMLWWALRAGMSWWSFTLIILSFYATMIGTARLVAAAGLTHPRPSPSARSTVIRLLGAATIDPRSLAMYSYLTLGYMQEPANFGTNYMMNSFKLIHSDRIRGRWFSGAVIAAAIGATLAGSVGLLWTAYHYGAVSMECWPITAVPTCTFREFTATLASPEKADRWLQLAVVVGGGFTLVLFWLTSRFVWWPLTPIGFIVASVYHTNRMVWTNALVGWALTSLIRRYGGLSLYRRLRPAFLGLILGQFLVSVFMAVFSATVLGSRWGLPEPWQA